MDSAATIARPQAAPPFETPRISADIDALAAQHSGRGDNFRAALSKLMKAELLQARDAAQATLLRDRHGRRCAERLC